MFIVSIDGGLGNQMFEYAFYLALKECYPDNKVLIDLSLMKDNTHNGYELQYVFGINAPIASLEDVAKLSEYCPKHVRYSKLINYLNKFRRVLLGVKWSYIVQEDSTAYYNEYCKLSMFHSYYFRGVWANVGYFECIKEKVLKEFTFPQITDKKNKELEERIREVNSVSIHFRKGDYVRFGFEILNKSYYREAIKYIRDRVKNPVFFVFSDDMDNAKKVIGEEMDFIFVEGNTGRESYIDMILMSVCKHNITGNSTFSFWSGYLNQNKRKIVIYPLQPVKGCGYPYRESNWIGIRSME